ncbi:hypothetical protein DID78_00685 [Candidatus Marinamargulisbacteria bacterium SCGC AG-343-D04]|nr:hypothetical protein DID78_00685 [Candidatus Marinamargulisbacteria bacterium SCGC AG-343-D04]
MNHEYDSHTSLPELASLSSSQQQTESLDFDERIQLFQMLSKSVLFKHQDVNSNDIKFWFPECVNNQTKDTHYKVIPKSKVEESLECVLAQFLEDDLDYI